MNITISGLSAIPVHRHEMSFVCRLSHDMLLCCGPLDQPIHRDHTITINGHPAEKPYLGITLSGTEQGQTVMVLRTKALIQEKRVSEIVISDPVSEIRWHQTGSRTLEDQSAEFQKFISTLSPSSQKKILFLLYNCYRTQSRAAQHPLFITIFHQARLTLPEQEKGRMKQPIWVSPDVLYWEMEAPYALTDPGQMIATTAQGIYAGRTESMVMGEAASGGFRIASLTSFAPGVWEKLSKSKVTLYTQQHQMPLSGILPIPESSPGRLLHYLGQLEQLTRQRVREFMAKHLRAWHREDSKTMATIPSLLRNLQLFVPLSHTSVHDATQPFGMNIEHLFPLGTASCFVSGWIRDPLERIESITMHSDLGFSVPVGKNEWQRFPKSYVDTMYQDNATANVRGNWGVIAQIAIPKTIQEELKFAGTLHGFRFEVRLEGGLTYSLTPAAKLFDPFYARQELLGNIAAYTANDPEADACVRDAVLHIQKLCAKQAAIQQTYQFGKAVRKPATSIIVPLLHNLDFIKPQLTHFSRDNDLRTNSEVIYVLDMPQQEAKVKKLLEGQSGLYHLPVKLIVMAQQAGLATAVNMAAKVAQGKTLLLMSADVLPKASGWLKTMQMALEKQPRSGAVSPKLVFEDESIQHAGMYFAPSETGLYENRHYYKGYPAEYVSANHSREVPAVTGACMLVRREHFNQVGGLTTDYVLAGFEDSDLCLKLRAKKRTPYYTAETVLYHLERQLNGEQRVTQEAAFRYNSWLHHQRWSGIVKRLARGKNHA